jgi:hypothetical protein
MSKALLKSRMSISTCCLLSKYLLISSTVIINCVWQDLFSRKHGEESRSVKVKSGEPQGTVLEPLMFLLYINDIGENIGSSVRLFADDSLIYIYKFDTNERVGVFLARRSVQHLVVY